MAEQHPLPVPGAPSVPTPLVRDTGCSVSRLRYTLGYLHLQLIVSIITAVTEPESEATRRGQSLGPTRDTQAQRWEQCSGRLL